MSYTEEIDQQSAIADKTIDALCEQISLYTEQLEEYDRAQGNIVMTCITFGGALIGIVISFLAIQKGDFDKDSLLHDGVMATLFLIVPSITTLYLYMFSMQCRRVAFFRGYLRYLEEELSKRTKVPILFNNKIVGKFFGEFVTNKIGPWIMTCFVVAIMGVGLRLIDYYSTFIAEEKCCVLRFCYYFLFRFVPIVCIVACGVFLYDLCANGSVSEKVYKYCICVASDEGDLDDEGCFEIFHKKDGKQVKDMR